jgi:hypothetical protein
MNVECQSWEEVFDECILRGNGLRATFQHKAESCPVCAKLTCVQNPKCAWVGASRCERCTHGSGGPNVVHDMERGA